MRTVYAKKKLFMTFGHTRSNSVESEFGSVFLKVHSATDFQYAIIASTMATRSDTLRDGLGFYIAVSS